MTTTVQQQRHFGLLVTRVVLMLLLLAVVGTWAWAPPSWMIHNQNHRPVVVVAPKSLSAVLLTTRLWATDNDEADQEAADAAATDAASDYVVVDDASLVTAAAEHPEVTAMKQEIAQLEEQLKEKHRELLTVKDLAEEFSKVGYARKVAEMENMRRFRSQLQSSNEYTATANVVTEFLPVLDELQRLKALYQEDAFGKSYNALAGNFQTALLELGVEEYTIPVGSPVDTRRVVVVDTEYSDTFAKNTVMRPVRLGLELKGNVVRLAECIASLGSEADAAAAATASEKETAADAEPAADEEETATDATTNEGDHA